jgi:hypothetical protein
MIKTDVIDDREMIRNAMIQRRSICLTKGDGDEGDTYPLRQRSLEAKLSAFQLVLSESQLQWFYHSSLSLRHLHAVIGISLLLLSSFQLQCVGLHSGDRMMACDRLRLAI